MKKTSKILAIICIALMLMTISVMSYAVDSTSVIGSLNGEDGTVQLDSVKTVGNQILTIVRVVGIIAAVIILVVLGIKYMMGSAEEKAEYKKTMLPYIIGALLLFGASAIVGIIAGVGETVGTVGK